MTDEEDAPVYKDGDIVWVKLGSSWWPGEVTTEAPEDLNFKNPPLAIVKFFNESTFEFVKNHTYIYPYNCSRKNDFIRKGMDSFRGNNPHMEKFPIDVSLAETKTNGNPNILSDPIFAQQKKTNITEEFGSSKSISKHGSRLSKGRTNKHSPKKRKVNITHRRFLGYDDYESHIREQYPGKDAENHSDEEVAPFITEEKTYSCSLCKFNTIRLEVMVCHVQCHVKGYSPPPLPPKKKKLTKTPAKTKQYKPRVTKTKPLIKHVTSDQELSVPSPKLTEIESPQLTSSDIKASLVTEWSDDEDSEEELSFSSNKMDTSDMNECPKMKTPEKLEEKEETAQKDINKSCFDFDEDEDEDDEIIQTTVGRKIPRVIPMNDRIKSTDKEEEEEVEEAKEEEEGEGDGEQSKIEDDKFKEVMESTRLPEIPILPEEPSNWSGTASTSLEKKPEINTEVATKLTNPKKRFVKSFEDFELLQNQQRLAEEERLKQPTNEDESSPKSLVHQTAEDSVSSSLDSSKSTESNLQISKLKCQIMSKLGDEENEPSRIKPNKSPSKSPRRSDPPKMSEKRARRSIEERTDAVIDALFSKIDKQPPKKSRLSRFDNNKQEEPEEKTKHKEDTEERTKRIEETEERTKHIEETEESTNRIEETEERAKHNAEREEVSKHIEETEERSEHIEETEVSTKHNEETKELEKHAEKPEVEPEPEKIHETPTPEPSPEIIAPEPDPQPIEETHPKQEMKRKMKQIHEYFNDFLFDVDIKPNETPRVNTSEENNTSNDINVIDSINNEVSNEVEPSVSEQKNESEELVKILEPENEENSALETLAMVSGLEESAVCEEQSIIQAEDQSKIISEENNKGPQTFEPTEEQINEPQTVEPAIEHPKEPQAAEPIEELLKETEAQESSSQEPSDDLPTIEDLIPTKPESEMITIDANISVVSEKDLADGQVEYAVVAPNNKKPVTLTNFSMDFSENNSNNNASTTIKESSKLLSLSDTLQSELGDLEEQIPHQVLGKPKTNDGNSKLLERLTTPEIKQKEGMRTVRAPEVVNKTSRTKVVIKSTTRSPMQSSKPVILSEKIFKPEKPEKRSSGNVSVQKVTSKRSMQDADEIDTFIIHKGAKTEAAKEADVSDNPVPIKKFKRSTSNVTERKTQLIPALPMTSGVKQQQQPLQHHKGKAKILQQTIITPDGEIIQPSVVSSQPQQMTQDENVFDINSMPIVLSDQILTPESIENMPIFLSDSSVQSTSEATSTTTKITQNIKKSIQPTSVRILNKSLVPTSIIGTNPQKITKNPKIIGSVPSKLIKHNTFGMSTPKQSKFVIVTQSSPTTTSQTPVSKYTVGKRQPVMRRAGSDMMIQSKTQNITSTTPTGNKIMIVTNQQGQQQKVLLTPAHQKMIGYQSPKVGRTIVKGNFPGSLIQKGKDGKMTAVPGTSGLITKSTSSSRMQQTQSIITAGGQVLTPISQPSNKIRIEKTIPSRQGSRIQIPNQKVAASKPQKTILIKNQQGQTVRKFQGVDDATLEQQVAEQLEAIKATGALQQQKQEMISYKSPVGKPIRRAPVKKPMESSKVPVPKSVYKQEQPLPPLAPISPKKQEHKTVIPAATTSDKSATETKSDRPLHQLVIQDAMGNQTTITEGQILALPSETVGGQPQSYMLVTLDESGNLTPLNNEALLSLDPNLGLGGELGNTELQIEQDPPAVTEETVATTAAGIITPEPAVITEPVHQETVVEETVIPSNIVEHSELIETPSVEVSQEQTVETSAFQVAAGGEQGQQLIVTGDPIAAQKFLESLTEGNADLANLLASAEGSSILIHADGQQILINADADNQMLLSVNADNLTETSEGDATFAPQPIKNQDILAAALADTDVFQQEQGTGKIAQLSPNSSGLYPANVGNVFETSSTLKSPIMTTSEAPSKKKIVDETDVLNLVPKNVDLPITITDPNISHTVSQQQVASMIANELQNNLELSLPTIDTASVTTSGINSPSFVYSLPNLDEAIDMNPKPFNSSMPLLTEDTDDLESGPQSHEEEKHSEVVITETTTEDLRIPQVQEESEISQQEESQVILEPVEISPEEPQINHDEIEELDQQELHLNPEPLEAIQDEIEENLEVHQEELQVDAEESQVCHQEELQPEPQAEVQKEELEDKVVEDDVKDDIEDDVKDDLEDDVKDDVEDDVKDVSTDSEKMLTPEFLDENEGLCTLGGEMCSSLSEPPPDMFDLSAVLSSHHIKSNVNDDKLEIMEENDLKTDNPDASKSPVNQESSTSATFNEDSCEIPLQPTIVTSLQDQGFNHSLELGEKRKNDGEDGNLESKRCKFD